MRSCVTVKDQLKQLERVIYFALQRVSAELIRHRNRSKLVKLVERSIFTIIDLLIVAKSITLDCNLYGMWGDDFHEKSPT